MKKSQIGPKCDQILGIYLDQISVGLHFFSPKQKSTEIGFEIVPGPTFGPNVTSLS